VLPAINQIELHPLLPQAELPAFHAEHGILTEAWSPLARGGAVLADPVIIRSVQLRAAADDLDAIASLETGERIGPDPDTFGRG
jgi:hypothetical protein